MCFNRTSDEEQRTFGQIHLLGTLPQECSICIHLLPPDWPGWGKMATPPKGRGFECPYNLGTLIWLSSVQGIFHGRLKILTPTVPVLILFWKFVHNWKEYCMTQINNSFTTKLFWKFIIKNLWFYNLYKINYCFK